MIHDFQVVEVTRMRFLLSVVSLSFGGHLSWY
jgi:hypothetical protein